MWRTKKCESFHEQRSRSSSWFHVSVFVLVALGKQTDLNEAT